MKIGLIGAGAVGAACLSAILQQRLATKIVVLDRDAKKAQGLATDMQYGGVLFPGVAVQCGDYDDLQGASLAIVTAGVNEASGGATNRNDPQGRLRLLDRNVAIYRDIIPKLDTVAPDAPVLVVTDPPDPLADAVRLLGHQRCLSTGTYLDSLRFRFHLARRLKVDAASVEALILGEHGTSEVFVWSSAQVAGRPVRECLSLSDRDWEAFRCDIEQQVRFANITIIEGIGASQHGIGMVTARIVEIMLRDERAVIPVGAYQLQYGVTLSLPTVLGRDGAVQTFEPDLSPEEEAALQRSAVALRSAVGRINI